jgi:methylamine dehydrogenase light chain
MDDLVERLARKLAAHTSRRRLLGMLGTALVGGVALPLLPVHRIVRAAEAADPANEPGDQMSCDYWRYCGFDGNLCGCCGGTLTDCRRDQSCRRRAGSVPAGIRSTARIT